MWMAHNLVDTSFWWTELGGLTFKNFQKWEVIIIKVEVMEKLSTNIMEKVMVSHGIWRVKKNEPCIGFPAFPCPYNY